MSTLRAACADNKWLPEGKQGFRCHVSPKVRFEFPFDAVCLSCHATIHRGTRANAYKSKEKDGNAYTFRTSSPCCKSDVEVRADVLLGTYIAVRGLRVRCHEEELVEETSRDVEVTKRTAMLDLEQKKEASTDYFVSNASEELRRSERARKKLRNARRKMERHVREGRKLGLSSHVALLSPCPEDEQEAKRVLEVESSRRKDIRKVLDVRRSIRASSIFSKREVSRSSRYSAFDGTIGHQKGNRDE